MEFLGVGYQEILLILALLLVVVGPERLPTMAYQMGRAVREMQKYARAVRDEFSEEMGYIEEQYRTVRGDLDEARTELQEQSRSFDREMREQTETLDREVKDASRDAESSLQADEQSESKQKASGANVVSISTARSQPGNRQERSGSSTRKAATGTTGRRSTSSSTSKRTSGSSSSKKQTDSETDAENAESTGGEEQSSTGEADRSDRPPLVF